MATKKIIEIEVDTGTSAEDIEEVAEAVEKVGDESVETAKKLSKTGKAAKTASKGFKTLGTALKAIGGMALLIKAIAIVTELFQSNQKIVDATATAFNFLEIAFNDFVNFITENFNPAVEAVTKFFEELTFEKIATAIQENLIERFESFLDVLGFVGDAVVKFFQGDFAGAMESAQNAGKEMVDVYTGVNDSFEKIGDTLSGVVDAVVDYTTETFAAAQANVELAKKVDLAASRMGLLNAQFLKAAEEQRQIRDNETLSFDDRIAAAEKLGEILDEQSKVLLDNAQSAVDKAQAQLALDRTNIEAQVALNEALAEQAGIEEAITGQRSEQMTSIRNLEREQEQERLDGIEADKQARLDGEQEVADAKAKTALQDLKDKIKADKKREQFQQAAINGVNSMFSIASSLAKDNAGLSKGIAIAETIWSTAVAVISQLKIAGPVGWAGAALAAVAGVVQLASIMKTDVDESGGSSGGSIAPPPAAPRVPASAGSSVGSVIGNNNPNAQIAGAITAGVPARAFVVGSDVTSQQELDRQIEQNATFG